MSTPSNKILSKTNINTVVEKKTLMQNSSGTSKQLSLLNCDTSGLIEEYLNPLDIYVYITTIRGNKSSIITSIKTFTWTEASFIQMLTCTRFSDEEKDKKLKEEKDIEYQKNMYPSIYSFAAFMVEQREFPVTLNMISNYIMHVSDYIRIKGPIYSFLGGVYEKCMEKIAKDQEIVRSNPTPAQLQEIKDCSLKLTEAIKISAAIKSSVQPEDNIRFALFKMQARALVVKQPIMFGDIRTILSIGSLATNINIQGLVNEVMSYFNEFPALQANITIDDIKSNEYKQALKIALLSFRKDLINDDLLMSCINLNPKLAQYMLHSKHTFIDQVGITSACIRFDDDETLNIALNKKYPYIDSELINAMKIGLYKPCRVLLKHDIKFQPDILDIVNANANMTEIILVLLKKNYIPSIKAAINAIMKDNMTVFVSYNQVFTEKKLQKTDGPMQIAIKYKKYLFLQYLLENDWPLPNPNVLITNLNSCGVNYDIFTQVFKHINKINSLEINRVNEIKQQQPEIKPVLYNLNMKHLGDIVINNDAVLVLELLVNTGFVKITNDMVDNIKIRGSPYVYEFVYDYREKLIVEKLANENNIQPDSS